MADYKTIKGFTIQSLASDPSNLLIGQVWFNTGSASLKGYGKQGTGAWASGGNMNVGRPGGAGAGTQTAAFAVGGGAPPIVPVRDLMETYDGTSWTEVADLTTAAQYNAASGSTTAGLNFGGYSPAITSGASELWDGTSWTAGNTMTTGRSLLCGFGTQTSSIAASGSIGPAPVPSNLVTNVEEFDGTSWTEVTDINTTRKYLKGSGTTTSGIIGPGATIPGSTVIANVEQYNGSTWTEVADVNTARNSYGMSKDGANTSAIIFCGNKPGTASVITEQWNGTSWTEVADVSNGTQECSGAGTGAFALLCMGNSPAGYTDTTEEFGAADATKTFTAS